MTSNETFERTYTIPGMSLNEAIDILIAEATRRGGRVVSDFNGVDIEAEPGITPSTVAWLWEKKRTELRRAAELKRELKRSTDLKVAVCEYLLSVNAAQDDPRYPFIPPTAIDWLGVGIVTVVLATFREQT